MQKGFIALPVLGMILLGTLLVGGGGYAIYKINQLESANDEKVAELEEKLNQIATTTEASQHVATSSESMTQVKKLEQIDIASPASIDNQTIVQQDTDQAQISSIQNQGFACNGNLYDSSVCPSGSTIQCKPEGAVCSFQNQVDSTKEIEKRAQEALDKLLAEFDAEQNSPQCIKARKDLETASNQLDRHMESDRSPYETGADWAEQNLKNAQRSMELSNKVTEASSDVRENCPTSINYSGFNSMYTNCTVIGNSVSCFTF